MTKDENKLPNMHLSIEQRFYNQKVAIQYKPIKRRGRLHSVLRRLNKIQFVVIIHSYLTFISIYFVMKQNKQRISL